MRNDLMDITLILDRSGSMDVVRDVTIEATNKFLAEQATIPGEVRVSLVQFDHEYEPKYTGVLATQVPRLTHENYVPRGTTALYDAVGRTINAVGERLSSLPAQDRPGKVLIVIQTDGFENASREFTAESLKTMILKQQNDFSWGFVFLGAGQDAILSASAIGIGAQASLSYNTQDPASTKAAFLSVSNLSRSYAARGVAEFTAEDRKKQKDTGTKW